MNEPNNQQSTKILQGLKNNWIIVIIVLIGLIIAGIFTCQKLIFTKNQLLSLLQSEALQNQAVQPNAFNNNFNFTYNCPKGWQSGENLDYNGQVKLRDCSIIYAGEYSFDDGISVSFGYVPNIFADVYMVAGAKYSDQLINEVKNESNAETYSNNNFNGWISMKNEKHTLQLIARYQVEDGYYEVSVNAVGDTRSDQDYKKIVDDIISSFSLQSVENVDASDWSIYDYKENGFSIKYPSGWATSIGRDGELFINFGTGATQRQLQVSISGTGGRTIDDLVKQLIDDPAIQYSIIKVGGVKAYKINDNGIKLVKNEKLFEFYATQNNDAIINKMIETVQFN
jgi:hypothetical protein